MEHPLDSHFPVTAAGFGVGCWLLQPDPAIEADTVPLVDVDVIVPEADADIVQPPQLRAGKVTE